MATVEELAFNGEFDHLKEIATAKGWHLEKQGANSFVITLPASDGSSYSLLFECDDFLQLPPAIHWYDPKSRETDIPSVTPQGQNYFHGSGTICAPWNRLAYKSVNPKGPHADWALNTWKSNPKTGETKTLSAMILRIFTELNSSNYKKRSG